MTHTTQHHQIMTLDLFCFDWWLLAAEMTYCLLIVYLREGQTSFRMFFKEAVRIYYPVF